MAMAFLNIRVQIRHQIINNKLDLPCRRGDYLRHAIFNLLSKQKNNDEINIDDILSFLHINDNEKIRTRIEQYINKAVEDGIIINGNDRGVRLSKKYLQTSIRIKKLVDVLENGKGGVQF